MAARRMMIPDYGTVSMKGTQYYRTRVTDQQGRRVSLYARTREELYQKEQEAIQQIPLYWHYHVGVVYLYLYRYLWPYDRDLPRVQKRRFSSKGGVRAFWEPGFSKPVKKSIKDVKSVTLASSDLPRRETTRGTTAYRKNRKLGKPSTHD